MKTKMRCFCITLASCMIMIKLFIDHMTKHNSKTSRFCRHANEPLLKHRHLHIVLPYSRLILYKDNVIILCTVIINSE